MKFIFAFAFYMSFSFAVAQISPDCSTAIPICNNTPVNSGTKSYGIDDFPGMSTSGCLERTISGFIESNSAWYRFKTNATGQLGFNIKIETNEDWDFALYKTDNCNNLGAPVRCNFKSNDEENNYIGVGEDPTGDLDNENYEEWLTVNPGESYYLLINNFSNVNSGFSIQFSGNIFVTNPYDALDCSIISNLLGPPIAACESDFVELDATIADALSYTWFVKNGNSYTEIIGETNPTLTVLNSAEYRVVVARPFENIISNVQVHFSKNPTANPVEDEYYCFDEIDVDLDANNAEILGTQDPAEYLVTYHSSFTDAVNGTNKLPSNYSKSNGSTTLYIRVSSFENPKCFDVSQNFTIHISDEIVQDFPLKVYLCEDNLVGMIGDDTPNSSYSYLWETGETSSEIQVLMAGIYNINISTMVGAITCEKSFSIEVVESIAPVISNVIIDDLQDNNKIIIETEVLGDFEYRLDSDAYQDSPIFENVLPGLHVIYVNDKKGCGFATENIAVVGFFKFFTPNNDGANDTWKIEGLNTLNSPQVDIFDRYGKLVKSLNSTQNSWDGSYNGVNLPASDYWFRLSYIDGNGNKVTAKYLNNHFTLKR